jgi:hypothetical protein
MHTPSEQVAHPSPRSRPANLGLSISAREVLKRQLVLRESYARDGKVDHYFVLFQENGASTNTRTHDGCMSSSKVGVRYREPYQAFASYISWWRMIGKNLIKLAQDDGQKHRKRC